MQSFDIAFPKIPESGIFRNNLDSTIRGIARKNPSKKCRCTIDTKGAENLLILFKIFFKETLKNKRAAQAASRMRKNARAIRFALKD
jgi:hypothetical protein